MSPTRRRAASLSTRLLVTQAVVVVASLATAGLVSSLIGPMIFHRHLVEAGATADSPELAHVEFAFRDAGALALAAGLGVAVVVAIAVSWYVGRRLRTPLRDLTHAAGRFAAGEETVRVPEWGNGQEIDELATAFNAMADTIAHAEETRRRLLTDVGHELRTPLATMAAHLDGLEDGIIAWDPQLQDLFRDEVTRMSALARDISAVSRAEEGTGDLHRQRIDLSEVVAAAHHELAGAYADKGVRLAVPSADPAHAADRTVLADPARIGQVLTNLLSNALRHTPPGGAVTVALQPAAGIEEPHRPGVAITVTDTGEGIAADQLPHVFERFWRGSTAREHDHLGSGVGLTISRALVRRHGGTLTAASDGPGRGSTFTLWLPGL
ncbi:HAMP domain-containing sensor histidine kinase [Raineyella sp. LH-20]|uniref:sensor histidine kinase n=1 Tax=Raineyella sp. LH-20 TaxID=3081204 RepID=UPI002953F9A1|nr:HAMP domain-containing sensor histidine kinase [Raineyella sp. LH-20]WOP19468.1 HAMP domain-containing sensor histidine kinase [Raineyella sp. LH-20]